MLRTENLKVYFTQHKQTVKALDGVDIFLKQGVTTAIAGESGCGKTTLARTILSFHKPREGKIYFQDKDITLKENRPLIRRNIQIVFQNPFLSVDPRYTVFSTLYEAVTVFPIRGRLAKGAATTVSGRSASNGVNKSQVKDIIVETLKEVELSENVLTRYPHQLSGGQLQRVCIARALINKPPLVILDEPTSALDIVTASKIMELLRKIQQNLGVTFVFISHNLRILGKISDFCFIMYYGKIMEYGPKGLIFKNPVHPYTKLLMKASYYNLKYLEDKRNPGRGCPFMPRCPLKTEKCEQDCQEKEVEPGHFVSCHLI